MPDDGHRYELLDRALLVTPAPNLAHQRCVISLAVLLHAGRGPEHEVLMAPFDVRLSRTTVLEPDLLVARKADLTPARLEKAPLLVVEVASPSTRRLDRGTKRLAYEAAGVPAYWLVDPDAVSLTVLQLEGDSYAEQGMLTGDEVFHATHLPVPGHGGPRPAARRLTSHAGLISTTSTTNHSVSPGPMSGGEPRVP